MCALKICMASLEIYGPGDAGNPVPPPADPMHVIMIPFDEAKEKKGVEDKQLAAKEAEISKEAMMKSGTGITLRSKTEVMQEVEGEESPTTGERRLNF